MALPPFMRWIGLHEFVVNKTAQSLFSVRHSGDGEVHSEDSRRLYERKHRQHGRRQVEADYEQTFDPVRAPARGHI